MVMPSTGGICAFFKDAPVTHFKSNTTPSTKASI
jgi:hypothetical protein